MGNGIHLPNRITEPTRRNIADELRLRKLDPSGRLDLVLVSVAVQTDLFHEHRAGDSREASSDHSGRTRRRNAAT